MKCAHAQCECLCQSHCCAFLWESEVSVPGRCMEEKVLDLEMLSLESGHKPVLQKPAFKCSALKDVSHNVFNRAGNSQLL